MRTSDINVVTFGEGMLELTGPPATPCLGDMRRLAYGGDVLNTSIYFARQGFRVRFLSALGVDAYSEELFAAWQAEGLDMSTTLRSNVRMPGLYAICTDSLGERSFSYWRNDSAFRELFQLPDIDRVLAEAAKSDLLYLSGITLSRFGPSDLSRLIEWVQSVVERGGLVAFDPNYRPSCWASVDAARQAATLIAPFVTYALPTLDDECALWGSSVADSVVDRWHGLGAQEVVVKLGASGCVWSDGSRREPVPASPVTQVIDTTGAGDAFNAGYIAGRLNGLSASHSAAQGHRLAAQVIQHIGAVIPSTFRS